MLYIDLDYTTHICKIISLLNRIEINGNLSIICDAWKHSWSQSDKEDFKKVALQAFDQNAIKKLCKEFSFC